MKRFTSVAAGVVAASVFMFSVGAEANGKDTVKAVPSAAISTESAAAVRVASPGLAAMPYTITSCRAKQSGVAHFADRFQMCVNSTFGFLQGSGSTVTGQLTGRYTLIGTATSTGSLNTSFKIALDNLEGTGTLAAPTLAVDLPCQGGGCSATTPRVAPLSTWKTRPDADFSFNSVRPTGNIGVKGAISVSFTVTTTSSATTSTPITSFRCDAASYIKNGSPGCVFPTVIPTLQYSRSDPQVKDVAEHIWRAQYDPSNTIPQRQGKIIPGAPSSGRPLHRLKKSTGQRWNRSDAISACKAEWGDGYSQGGVYECDEYPFSTTYEGARLSGGNYSVQVMTKAQNGAGGTAIGVMYSESRVLDGDAFYVEITP